jgi:hypothetical protein
MRKVNERRNVPSVDGAMTRWPSTAAVWPVRSTSASSMQSPPATMACTSVNTLRPGRWWPGRSPRSTSWSTACSIPSRSASVAGSNRPALATAWSSSKRRQAGRAVGGWHRESALQVGSMAGLAATILPAQRAFLITKTWPPNRHRGGSRLRQAPGCTVVSWRPWSARSWNRAKSSSPGRPAAGTRVRGNPADPRGRRAGAATANLPLQAAAGGGVLSSAGRRSGGGAGRGRARPRPGGRLPSADPSPGR